MTLSENTLFERLRDDRAARDPSMSLDRVRLMDSIAANLQRIFSSREMHAPAQLDYGMPDPNTILHALDGGADLMRSRLKLCIENYEPRLTDIRVQMLQSAEIGHQMQFSIKAALATDPPERVVLKAAIEASGRISVTP
jgi:type VI secretion system protein